MERKWMLAVAALIVVAGAVNWWLFGPRAAPPVAEVPPLPAGIPTAPNIGGAPTVTPHPGP